MCQICRIWPKSRVAQTTKDTKFGIVGGSSKDLFKEKGDFDSKSRRVVSKIDALAKA